MFNKLSARKLAIRMYWRLQGIRRQFFGTRVDETIWKQTTAACVREHLVNVLLPHRVWLVDKILSNLEITSQRNLEPGHTSVLEIGCGGGANLEVIARRAPSLRLVGVDISPASIAVGRERFEELGLGGRVTLVEGQADNLSGFANASVDVVFTDAVLLLIGPDKIKQVVREMMRVACRRLVMLEFHQAGFGALGRYTRDGWLRDYMALLSPLVGENAVRLEKLPSGLRTAGRWPQYGTLIEVDLTKKERSITE